MPATKIRANNRLSPEGVAAIQASNHKKLQDLTRKIFGRLTVIGFSGAIDGQTFWRVVCSCPARTRKVVNGSHLKRGRTTSCGCVRRELQAARRGPQRSNFKHGHAAKLTPTYTSWRSAVKRCTNPNDPAWSRYGGNGVSVCARWLHSKHGYEYFLADMGERPKGASLSRYLDTGNYQPGNVEWGTKAQQTAEKMAKKAMLKYHEIKLRAAKFAA
jgi:hypothetical protein